MSRGLARLATALALLLPLTACTAGDGESSSSGTTPTPTATASSSPTPPPTARPAPVPDNHACYRLDYDEAIAPTSERDPVDCGRTHTSITFDVGRLDTVVDGHLLAIDSDRVQAQAAQTCPEQLAEFVGGTLEDRRLSMLRAVWFTPTVEESDAGASWYRCDAIAVASDERLAPLTGQVGGVLDRPDGLDRYGMCGTAEPGTEGFSRVICSRDHSWRAISVVPFAPGDYPGADAVRERGQQPCEDAARDIAEDTLSFRWGYEWPTEEQWSSGQTYGLCWAPD